MSKIHLAAMIVSLVVAAALPSSSGENAPPPVARSLASRPAPTTAHLPGLSPEQREELMAFAKVHMPELHEQLLKLEKDNPARLRLMLMGVNRLYQQVQRYPAEVRDAAIARHRANLAIIRAKAELRAATDPDAQARLTQRLKGLLAEQFDNDLIVKKYEVERLTRQLADLKGEIESRSAKRQSIIEENLKKLLAPETRPAGRAEEPRP